MLDFNLALTDIASLTGLPFQPMIDALSGQLKGGICTPKTLGFQKPLTNVVFLCPVKTIQAVLIRLKSVLVGCVRQPLWLTVPRFGSAKPDTVRHPEICTNGRRLNPSLSRTTAMTTITGETSPQNPQTEFKDAAIALCGGSAFLFLPNPSQAALTQVIAKCERLLIAAKALLEVDYAA